MNTINDADLASLLKEKHNGKKTDEFYKDVERLKSGEPLAYVIGNIPFLDCIIDLSKKPLIPRSETEFWVYNALQAIPTNKKLNILDVFSGSGCVGIALAKHLPQAHITCADINTHALEQIKINKDINNIPNEQINIVESNVFSNLREQYDYIFANPPYISKEDIDDVEESVLLWEPHTALFAEDNGLIFIKKLIDERGQILASNGIMYIEIGERQKDKLSSFLQRKDVCFTFLEDQYKKCRVLKIENHAKNPEPHH